MGDKTIPRQTNYYFATVFVCVDADKSIDRLKGPFYGPFTFSGFGWGI
jgi:hypothetical protein